MKLSKLFFGFAAAAMFAACSSYDNVAEEPQEPQVNIEGESYMAFSIGMPEQASTRAENHENDQFNNGLEAEYAVKNVALLLFQGTSDATATFHSAYDLGNDAWSGANTDSKPNVTADKKFVAKVQGSISNPRAFVVLNNNGIFTVDGATGSLKINDVLVPVGTSFSDIQALVNKADLDLQASDFHKDDTNGFLMMNAPLFDKKGTTKTAPAGGKIRVLAPVAAASIYDTKDLAEASTATTTAIYVERAVAKLSMTKAASLTGTATPFTVVLNGWSLDNTNKTSYLVRNTEDFDTWAQYADATYGIYRFPGAQSVKHPSAITQGTAATEDMYRTYFAKDPNYSDDGTKDTFNKATAYTTSFDPSVGNYMYCAENTFDVERMKYKNTTRVIVKATVTPKDAGDKVGTGFYSAPGDDKFYSVDQMKDKAWSKVYELLKPAADATLLTGLGAVTYTVTPSADYKSFTVKTSAMSYTGPDTDLTALVAALTGSGKEYTAKDLGYGYYAGGEVYYEVRVKHFGDTYTPWTNVDSKTIDDSYPSTNRAQNFLGRWGMLRNNWYELEVTSVGKIGFTSPDDINLYPTTTPGPEDPWNPEWPDDNQESEKWLSIDVNILSWAQRFQDVKF